MIRAISWTGDIASGVVEMIDQRRLPDEEIYHSFETVDQVADAIRDMIIRGAPAIGIAAAMGYVLGIRQAPSDDVETRRALLERIHPLLANTRPTAVNLFWALDRMRRCADTHIEAPHATWLQALHEEALAIQREDVAMNRAIGQHGLSLFDQDSVQILTHCNTGSLATGGLGTAFGVIHALHGSEKKLHVWVDETRPYLQGARLTAWECLKEGIPATLITDSMAGFFMLQGEVDAVIIGADRIAANGDTANKIGSYSLAVLCKHHNIPFYVAAPSSTLDFQSASGQHITIEERSAREVTHIRSTAIAPEGVHVRHPAFDVTPATLISAIITERGVAQAPFDQTLIGLGQ